MKKLLFTTLLAFPYLLSTAQVCTPNISCVPSGNTFGICPDSATGLPIGTVGVPYSAVVSLLIPADGTDFGQPSAKIVDIEIKSITGLAPGLTYTCVPANCIFPKSTSGCALISGTPTAVHNQPVVVNADAHVTVFTVPVTQPQTFAWYRSVVVAPSSVETLDLTKFDVKQNIPNPFSSKAEIHFSSPESSKINFVVYNIVGAVVYKNDFYSEKGANTITINANSFSPGVYIYSVTNGNQTITKRMIVSNK